MRARLIMLAVCLPVALTTHLAMTWSTYTVAASRTQTITTPATLKVGLLTPTAQSTTTYTIAGLAPGQSADELLNALNDGSTPSDILLAVSSSTNTALDTDATNGLHIELDDCTTAWQQASPGAAATCAGTQTTILPATALATAMASPTLESTGLSILSPGGSDHLRVRFSLPAGAPGGYASLTSGPILSLTGVTTPGAPTSVTATPGNSQVTINWGAPANTGNTTITGYAVSASPGGKQCFTTTATSCSVTGLTNGTAYTFTVVATNAAGNGPGASVSGTPITTPGAPTAVSATGGVGAASISWSAPASNGGAAVSGYTATATATGQTTRTCITTGATTCSIMNLAGAVNYTFTVTATNAAGTGTGASTTATTQAGPLDGLSATTAAAYSLRRLYAGYTGNAIQVQRASDNATKNIGFTVAGGLDTTTLNSFCAATTCTVQTWYDQSGTGANATQATVADQPTIVSNGTLITSNGLAAMNFAGNGTTSLTIPITATTLTANDTATINAVFNPTVGQNGWLVGIVDNRVAAGNDTGLEMYNASSADADWGTASLYQDWSTYPTVEPGASNAVTFVNTGSSQLLDIDGATTSNTLSTLPVTGSSDLIIGADTIQSNRYFIGTMQEVLVTTSALSTADRQTLDAAQTGYYAINLLPGAPTAVSATAGVGAASISWSAPAFLGGGAITGYTVTATASGQPTETCTTTGATTCSILNLTAGANYSFTVTATNVDGTGPSSSAATATPTAGPLDSLSTTPSAAYSLRRLLSAYTGYAIQVHRASDSTTKNIGFTVAGGLDTSTLATFCASTTCTVQTWYDQSGNGNNAVQTTVAHQPTIYTGGAVETQSGVPTIYFGGSAYLTSSTGFPTNSDYTVNAVVDQTSTSTLGNVLSGNSQHAFFFNGSTNPSLFQGSGAFASGPSLPLSTLGIVTGTFVNSTGTGELYTDGAAGTPGTTTNHVTDATMEIGAYLGGQYNLTGYISEADVYSSVLSAADQRTLESGQASDYTIDIVPSSPTALTVTPGVGAASASWTAPSSNGGSTITGYTVTATASGQTTQTCTTTGATTCSIMNLTAGVAYTFTVVATNSVGTGTASAAATATPTAGPLDSLSTTPVAAFSLRRLRSGYTGYAIQVLRASDSTTKNIGFTVAGGLDTSTLTTFCASTTCTVQTWYDQSSNANNATQATVADQPVIVNSGTLETLGGSPTVDFVSSSSDYLQTIATASASGSFAINAVSQSSGYVSNTAIGTFAYNLSTPNNLPAVLGPVASANLTAATYAASGSQWVASTGTTVPTVPFVATSTYSGTSTQLFANGVAQTAAVTTAGLTTTGKLLIAKHWGIAAYYYGLISEITYFPSLSTADRQTLEHSQESYYGISGS